MQRVRAQRVDAELRVALLVVRHAHPARAEGHRAAASPARGSGSPRAGSPRTRGRPEATPAGRRRARGTASPCPAAARSPRPGRSGGRGPGRYGRTPSPHPPRRRPSAAVGVSTQMVAEVSSTKRNRGPSRSGPSGRSLTPDTLGSRRGRPRCRPRPARRAGVGGVAGAAPRHRARGVAADRQEGLRPREPLDRRGPRRRAVLRLDRRPASGPRRRVVPPEVLPTPGPQHLVPGERREGRPADGRGPDAPRRPGRGRRRAGRRPVGRGVRTPVHRHRPRRPGRRPRRRPCRRRGLRRPGPQRAVPRDAPRPQGHHPRRPRAPGRPRPRSVARVR